VYVREQHFEIVSRKWMHLNGCDLKDAIEVIIHVRPDSAMLLANNNFAMNEGVNR